MRNISRVNIEKPIELDSDECKNHLNSIIADPNTKVLSDFYKGKKVNLDGSSEFTVRESLKILYKNKCAYCEKLSHAPKIDHHRPKGRVVGTNNQNKGYYWLCYEWTNFLPSCTDCNSIEAKGSRYPVIGNRNSFHPVQGIPPIAHVPDFVYNSVFNTSEQPLLLHPEYCNPISNFEFDKQGKIIGTTPEGIKTVEVLKIDNPDLNGWRRKIYNDHLAALLSIVRKFFRAENPINEDQFKELIFDWTEKIVEESNDETLEYTLFRKYLLNRIDFFFVTELDPIFQDEVNIKIAEALLELST